MGKQGGTGLQNTNWSQRLLTTKKNVDRRKSRNMYFFGPYEYEIRNRSQIRIRIYVLDVFAVKIRIGPLIFSPIRQIRGVQYLPPSPCMLLTSNIAIHANDQRVITLWALCILTISWPNFRITFYWLSGTII